MYSFDSCNSLSIVHVVYVHKLFDGIIFIFLMGTMYVIFPSTGNITFCIDMS